MIRINTELAERNLGHLILKIERYFQASVGKRKIKCMIEKHVICLDDYRSKSLNSQKQNVEIAVRIGNDLLPLLVGLEKRELHRDIKPENIFLRGKTLDEGLCLGDFGIATHLNAAGNPTTITVAGTYNTMSADFKFEDEKHS